MVGCFTSGMCHNLVKIQKDHVVLLKNVSSVVANTKKSLKCVTHTKKRTICPTCSKGFKNKRYL